MFHHLALTQRITFSADEFIHSLFLTIIYNTPTQNGLPRLQDKIHTPQLAFRYFQVMIPISLLIPSFQGPYALTTQVHSLFSEQISQLHSFASDAPFIRNIPFSPCLSISYATQIAIAFHNHQLAMTAFSPVYLDLFT